MDKSSLMYPLFVMEGTENKEEEIPSMDRDSTVTAWIVFHMSWSSFPEAGVGSVMLFGIPDHKDEVGSGAYDPNTESFRKLLAIAKETVPGSLLCNRCMHV